jgi:hypothetical protein
VGHTSLLPVAGVVLQFAVKYLAPPEMKVAAVCLSVCLPACPSHICDSIVSAAAYFPTRLLASKMTIDSVEVTGVDMLLLAVLHNTLISNLTKRKQQENVKYYITSCF